jgi:signal transduction histidine kinase
VKHISRDERRRGPGAAAEQTALYPSLPRVARGPAGRLGIGFIVACAAAALLFIAGVDPAAAEPKRVLLLHSLGRDFAPFADVSGRFREELIRQSTDPVDYYEISLETARFAGAEQEKPFVDYLQALFAQRKLDLVVPVGAPAARFALRHRERLFGSAPMLFVAMDLRSMQGAGLTANDAVVAYRFDLPAVIDNILRLRPQTVDIAVVTGNSDPDRAWLEELHREFQPLTNRVKFVWLDKLSFADQQKLAATLPPWFAVFFTPLQVDVAGVPIGQDRALESLRAVSSAPVFGTFENLLGRGVVGGPAVSSNELGQRAASVAMRILQGEAPASIETQPLGPGRPMYDWRELRAWNISENALPPGSEVRFRERSLWDMYRWQIILVATTLLLQATLITVLLFEHRRRRNAEALARRRMSELAHVNRMATAGELSASLAHEIKQPLAAMVTNANAGLRWLGRSTPDFDEARSAFQRIVSDGHRAGQVLGSVRAMFEKDSGKRAQVDINGVIREVLALLEGELRAHRVLAQTDLLDGLPEVSGNRVQLQQVIVNLVMNAVEAMEAIDDRPRLLRIKTEIDNNNHVLIRVEDSGPGIGLDNIDRIFNAFFTTKPRGIGMGLSICRSIVEAHDGRLWVSPGVDYGSVFQFTIPNHNQKKRDERIGPEPLPRAEQRQPAAASPAREPVAILRTARHH